MPQISFVISCMSFNLINFAGGWNNVNFRNASSMADEKHHHPPSCLARLHSQLEMFQPSPVFFNVSTSFCWPIDSYPCCYASLRMRWVVSYRISGTNISSSTKENGTKRTEGNCSEHKLVEICLECRWAGLIDESWVDVQHKGHLRPDTSAAKFPKLLISFHFLSTKRWK